MPAPGREVVTILDAPLVTDPRFGTQRRDWNTATSTTLRGCSVQPISGVEATVDREFTKSHLKLFAPFGELPKATSRVVHDGTTYEVDGEPERWRDSNGRPCYILATLKRLAG